MCGIVALVSRNVDTRTLLRASDAIAHRGPDGNGIWVSPLERCGLANVRFSLNDLSGGGQPLSTAAGRVAAVVNGEFYDYERIRADLENRGHKLWTNSDSEIVLPLYLEEGFECLKQLRGEFAFALWDDVKQVLFAARDRFGMKPLYYARVGEDVVIASEIKALFAAGLERRWDSERVIDHLMLCHGPGTTLFRGVRQVPPGHYIVVKDNQIEVRCYWDVNFPRLQEQDPAFCMSRCVERIDHELQAAVRLRQRADVPVGCFLSGGLDSAAVLGLATAHEESIMAFTVGFDEDVYDERERARNTADFNDAALNIVLASQTQMAKAWERSVWHAETIYDNGRGMARLVQCDAVRAAGVKAVLVGEGADEFFGGYFFSQQDYARSSGLEHGGASAMRTGNTPLVFQSSIAGQHVVGIKGLEDTVGFTPSWLYGAVMRRGAMIRELLSEEFKAAAVPDVVISRMLDDLGTLNGIKDRHPVHKSLYMWIKTFLPNMILMLERLEMAAPVETRVPFLDHHFVEAVQQIPAPSLFRDGLEKYPLRVAVKDRIPDAVFSRPKQPFTAPHALRSQNGAMKEYIGDTIRGAELDSCVFFDRERVLKLFDRSDRLPPAAGLSADQALMLVTHVCLLQKHFRLAL